MQHQPRHRVDHGGVTRDRDHVARGLDGLLLGLAFHALAERNVLPVLQAPEILEPAEGEGLQALREFGVSAPRLLDAAGVDLARRALEGRGNVCGDVVEPHVALALLLGVVEGKAVQERPHQLPRDARDRELEGGVLEDRVMATIEGQRADAAALPLGDLVGVDDAGRIARAGRGDRVVVGSIRRAAQADLGSAIHHRQGICEPPLLVATVSATALRRGSPCALRHRVR